jgi:hypothetical protein
VQVYGLGLRLNLLDHRAWLEFETVRSLDYLQRSKLTRIDWVTLKGSLQKGYRVASGPSETYPEYGSIEKQKPYFKELGLDLDGMFNGTLNISIHPYEFRMTSPEFTFEKVKWTELTNAEDFSFSECKVRYKGRAYHGWVYYPHPGTKKEHFQDASTMEVLAPYIHGIQYGDALEISINPDEIALTKKDGS